MPRVTTKTKATRGAAYHCGKCGEKIKPGTKYYEWSFRYGGTRRQHEACGFPRRGQLTQSKMGAVYDAIDDAETTIATADTASDIADAVRSAAEVVNEIELEYRDAADAMGAAGESGISAERADELESFASDLEGEADNIADEERDEENETEEQFIERLREQATDALDNCPC
jgi:hypothetical protein